jgi:hypothetical protein
MAAVRPPWRYWLAFFVAVTGASAWALLAGVYLVLLER